MTPPSTPTPREGKDPAKKVGTWNAMIRRARLTDWQKLVCLTVSTYADSKGGGIHPGIAGLMVDLGRNRSTIEDYLRWMRESGLIEVERRGNRRAGESDVYRLVIGSTPTQHVTVLTPEEYLEAKDVARAQIRAENAEKRRRYLAKHRADPGKHRTGRADHQPRNPSDEPRPMTGVDKSPKPQTEPGLITAINPGKAALSTPTANAVTSGSVTPSSSSTFHSQAKAGGLSTLTDGPGVPESLRIVARALGAMDPSVTADEAKAVHHLIVDRHHPRSVKYFSRITEDGGYGRYLAEVRAQAAEERSVAIASQVTELRQGPNCDHGIPGGAALHPASGKALCPLCRRGAPPTDRHDDGPTPEHQQVAIEWGKTRQAAGMDGPPMPILTAVMAQAQRLLAAGVGLRDLLAVARDAGTHNIDLDTQISIYAGGTNG